VAYDQQKILAGHLLRRLGFGPNATEVADVLNQGFNAYIDSQLDPQSINDKSAQAKFAPTPTADNRTNTTAWQRRWYSRMVYSRRQLLEKMTLFWHEYFATSNAKVANGLFMHQQEELFRAAALGNFRNLLIAVSKDKAMLIWLDNLNNSGTERDQAGNLVPPNQNFARELMQLFALGTVKLNDDGSPIYDTNGQSVPTYSENDVKEVARALTGWSILFGRNETYKVVFAPNMHDTGNKVILGQTIQGRSGQAGAQELDAVVDLLLSQSTHAPYLCKILLQKLATETPSATYISNVVSVYRSSNGSIKATVEAILKHPEFISDAVVRSQYRTPIEHLVGAVRGLEGNLSRATNLLIDLSASVGHQVYYPPSVFSFYRPGKKRALVNTAFVTNRDQGTDAIVTGQSGVSINYSALRSAYNLTTPDQVVDFLGDALIVAPLVSSVRSRIVSYMDGQINNDKFLGAAWLVLCSPDYQRN